MVGKMKTLGGGGGLLGENLDRRFGRAGRGLVVGELATRRNTSGTGEESR